VEFATEGTEQSEPRMELLSILSSLDEKNSSSDKKTGVGSADEEGIGVVSDVESSTSMAGVEGRLIGVGADGGGRNSFSSLNSFSSFSSLNSVNTS
jgi:hypothetical protein